MTAQSANNSLNDMFKKHPLQRGCFFFDSLSVTGSRRVCPIASRSYHTHNQSPIDSPFCTSDLSLFKKWGVFCKKTRFYLLFLVIFKKNTNFVSFFASGKYNVSLFNA